MKELTFLRTDYRIQSIIGIMGLLFTPFYFLGIFLLLPFGIWQVISSVIMVYGYRNKKRVIHLVVSIIWFCFYMLFSEKGIGAAIFSEFQFLYVIVLPLCIGICYYVLTKREYKALKEKELAIKNEYV